MHLLCPLKETEVNQAYLNPNCPGDLRYPVHTNKPREIPFCVRIVSSVSTGIYDVNMEYTNHPGIGMWVVAIHFSVGKNHDITTRNRQVDSILLGMHVIGSEICTKNLVAIETIMLEEDFIKS